MTAVEVDFAACKAVTVAALTRLLMVMVYTYSVARVLSVVKFPSES